MSSIELHNRDCLEVLKEMPSESIDLVVTDCPYIICGGGKSGLAGGILGRGLRTYGDERDYVKDKHGNSVQKGTKHVNLCGIFDERDSTTYAREGKLFKHNDIDFADWLPDVYRVLKNGTHCYIMINARNLKDLQQKAEDVGFEFQQLLVWDKGNSCPNNYYMNSYELVLMLRKGNAKNINNLGTSNILRIPNRTTKHHPTQKPVALMRVLIENSSKEGEIVLDPFMGGGSTGIAAKELKRRFIGIEIDEKYFNIAKERIEQGRVISNQEQMTLF